MMMMMRRYIRQHRTGTRPSRIEYSTQSTLCCQRQPKECHNIARHNYVEAASAISKQQTASWSRKSDTQQQQMEQHSEWHRKRRAATATSVRKQQTSKQHSKSIRDRQTGVENRRTATATASANSNTGVERDAQQQHPQSEKAGIENRRAQQHPQLGHRRTDANRNRQKLASKKGRNSNRQINEVAKPDNSKVFNSTKVHSHHRRLEHVRNASVPRTSTSGPTEVAQHLKNGFSRRIPASLSHSPSSS